MKAFCRASPPFWLFLSLGLIVLVTLTPLDLGIARYFYQMGENTELFFSHPLFDWLYIWALVPGQLLFISSCIALLLSYITPRCMFWRTPALYLVLTLATGSGLITHALLKEHWGRPRPKQVKEFGGNQEFRPFWKPNFFHQPEPSKSFPCGHCTMGFYFFSVAQLGERYKKRALQITGLALAFLLGIALGVTRMAQGGHFFSDVLFSGIVMWGAAIACDKLLFEKWKK